MGLPGFWAVLFVRAVVEDPAGCGSLLAQWRRGRRGLQAFQSQETCAAEAFGPVAVLSSFDDFEGALHEVNDSVFGLQAGIFTRDLVEAHRAWDELGVGGVIIGDIPSWRVDNMPYGGVKDSGLEREGLRWAMA